MGRKRSMQKRHREDNWSQRKSKSSLSQSQNLVELHSVSEAAGHEIPISNKGPQTATIPEFDPSKEKHRIDFWLATVNTCAEINKWDEVRTIKNALGKLAGEAKKWYQTQMSVEHTWARWQTLLSYAFPCDDNYALLLEEMLDRRLNLGEDLEEYYYDKMALLYACEITGTNAVDCVIHGIDDCTVQAVATAAHFREPEALFTFLKDVCNEQKVLKKGRCV